MEACADLPFDVQLHRVPFFLEPDYAPGYRESHQTRMVRKFGSAERFEAFKKGHGLVPRAAEVGVEWTEQQLSARVQSSTLRSHRLVQWVSKRYGIGAAEALYTAMGRRHFSEGGVLDDLEMLMAAVGEVDAIDVEKARVFLGSDEGVEAILAAVALVGRLNIHSIPTLIVDGQFVLDGGCVADEVEEALRNVHEGGGPSGKRIFGGCLDL